MHVVMDTNAYTAYMQGKPEVLDILGLSEHIFMSVVVMGELYAGFRGGMKYSENKKRLQQFLQKTTVHISQITPETAEIFGRVKNQLKVAGTPIPFNDVWLAAQAIETGSVMVTYDQHFSFVAGLRVWDFEAEGER